MITERWLIYGTGTIAQNLALELCRIGHQPIIAGADEQAVLTLAETVNCEYRVFAIDKPYALQQQLNDIAIVLDASEELAAPFSQLLNACLKSSCHYITLQPWPNYPGNAEALEAKATQLGLVLAFSTSFLPQALALWQVNACEGVDYFVIQDFDACMVSCAAKNHWLKMPLGFLVANNPKTYWRAGSKTVLIAGLNRVKAWAFKIIKKPLFFTVKKADATVVIQAFRQRQCVQELTFNLLQMQQFNQRSAIFLLESILASKILPGLYSGFEVVDNNPLQAEDFVAQLFPETRAQADE